MKEINELKEKLIKFLEENQLIYISSISGWNKITIYKNNYGGYDVSVEPLNRY